MPLEKVVATTFGHIVVHPLPAFVQAHLYTISGHPTLPVEVVSGLGGTEVAPARPGTPEYEQYIKAAEAAEERRRKLTLAAAVGIGVSRWEIGGVEYDSVPDDWEPPDVYREITLSATIDPVPPITDQVLRKADYLLLTVLVNPDDLDSVVRAAVGGVTEQDIQAAEKLFRR